MVDDNDEEKPKKRNNWSTMIVYRLRVMRTAIIVVEQIDTLHISSRHNTTYPDCTSPRVLSSHATQQLLMQLAFLGTISDCMDIGPCPIFHAFASRSSSLLASRLAICAATSVPMYLSRSKHPSSDYRSYTFAAGCPKPGGRTSRIGVVFPRTPDSQFQPMCWPSDNYSNFHSSHASQDILTSLTAETKPWATCRSLGPTQHGGLSVRRHEAPPAPLL
jgi:hypothetical protein